MFTFLARLVVRVEFLLPRYIGSVFILRTFAFLISTLYISHRIQSQSHQMIKWAWVFLTIISYGQTRDDVEILWQPSCRLIDRDLLIVNSSSLFFSLDDVLFR